MSVVQNFFNKLLREAMSENPRTFQQIGYQYTFNITGEGGGEWYVNASNSGPLVQQGNLGEFDCHITMTAQQCQKCCQNPNDFMVLIVNEEVEISINRSKTKILTGVLRIFGLGRPFGLDK